MIDQIMDYLNNHFVRSGESDDFEIVTDGIVGDFDEKYIAGQYIWIQGSFINDGVYLLTGVSNNKLTVADDTFTAENTGESIRVFGCAVPKPFLTLVDDINSWISENAGKEGIASETIDSYSVSFGSGPDGSTANSWQSAFAGRLSTYRAMYEDLSSYQLDSSIYTKWR